MKCRCGKALAEHMADGWKCDHLSALIAKAQGWNVYKHGGVYCYEDNLHAEGFGHACIPDLTTDMRLIELIKWVMSTGVQKSRFQINYVGDYQDSPVGWYFNGPGRSGRGLEIYYFDTFEDAVIMAACLKAGLEDE